MVVAAHAIPLNRLAVQKPTGYIPSLDGIRALAIIVVIISHTGYGNLVPGRAGVTVFFFLSGYLITTLLVREFEKKGTIDVKKFFARRFIRLLPPLLIVVPVVHVFALLGWIPGESSIKSLFSQLFYLANYFEIAADAGKRPAGLVVLWSLAIEEHFYVLYPLILLPLLKRFNYRKVGVILIGLCVACLMWRMFLVAQPGDIGNRTAFGTDTRFDSILWGCVLALAQSSLKAKIPINRKRLPVHGYGMLIFAGLAFGLTLMIPGEFFRESIRYSIQGVALLPVFYYAVTYHASHLFRFLELPEVKKLGVYSYVMYLTHFSIYHLLQTNFPIFAPKMAVTIATFWLSVALAAIFDHYVDSRLRALRRSLR